MQFAVGKVGEEEEEEAVKIKMLSLPLRAKMQVYQQKDAIWDNSLRIVSLA